MIQRSPVIYCAWYAINKTMKLTYQIFLSWSDRRFKIKLTAIIIPGDLYGQTMKYMDLNSEWSQLHVQLALTQNIYEQWHHQAWVSLIHSIRKNSLHSFWSYHVKEIRANEQMDNCRLTRASCMHVKVAHARVIKQMATGSNYKILFQILTKLQSQEYCNNRVLFDYNGASHQEEYRPPKDKYKL